jgi:ParB family chromosome partitioning protein
LEALLGRPPEEYGEHGLAVAPAPTGDAGGMVELNVYEVEANPFQPRRDFGDEELAALTESLKQHGLVQPITVRRVEQRYQLVAGERRLRAAIKAGWQQVPAQVVEVDDRQMAELAIVENLHRKDLNAMEKAASFQGYLERYQTTQEELAGRLKIDRSTVANLIRLLELPQEVQQSIRSGAIGQGHARALLPLGEEQEQVAFCKRIVAEGLSVRAVETLVQQILRGENGEALSVLSADGSSKPAAKAPSQLSYLEQEFRTALGTKVDVRQTAKGSGRIVVHFKNADEFERIHAQLCSQDGRRQQAG